MKVEGDVVGYKLFELPEGSKVKLCIHNEESSLEMGATIKKHIKTNASLIDLDYDTTRKLVFENVQIRMEYSAEGEIPIIWNNVNVINFKSEYVVQTPADGIRNNRRNSFRVGVSKLAQIIGGNASGQVMIRDISLSGFAISDRKKELSLSVGDEIAVRLEDIGHDLKLRGQVVRIEEHEDVRIYGLAICNLCRDLSSYVTLKQRRTRETKADED